MTQTEDNRKELYERLERVLNDVAMTDALHVTIQLLAGIMIQTALKTDQPIERVIEKATVALDMITRETAAINIPPAGALKQ